MKIFDSIKLLFDSFKFAIRYFYQVKFNKSNDRSPIKYALVQILNGYPSKVEYLIFDKNNPLFPILHTSIEKHAIKRYNYWIREYGKENLVFIKVENMET